MIISINTENTDESITMAFYAKYPWENRERRQFPQLDKSIYE